MSLGYILVQVGWERDMSTLGGVFNNITSHGKA